MKRSGMTVGKCYFGTVPEQHKVLHPTRPYTLILLFDKGIRAQWGERIGATKGADGNADYLITGDDDLLVLETLGKTKIVMLSEFEALHG